MKTRYKDFSEARLGNAQDKVLKGYVTRFKLTPEEADDLHMFFSPSRVPKGMNEKEVREALQMYVLRNADRTRKVQKLTKLAGKSKVVIPASRSITGKRIRFTVQNPPSFRAVIKETILPAELVPTGQMTRRKWNKGMRELRSSIVCK